MVGDETYQIIGINTADGEAVNDLIQREDREVFLWTRDTNQDGFMDLVLRGDITLDEANRIYHQGIRIAAEMGKYQQREYPRSYRIETDEHIFTVITVLASPRSESVNQFIIHIRSELQDIRLYDRNMDGQLDGDPDDVPELQRWQEFYTATLEQGIEDQRIELRDGRYFVRQRQTSPNEPVIGTIIRFN